MSDGHHHCESSLSDKDLARLEHFLIEHMESDHCMPLDVAHGFLTAVLSGPRLIMPSQWLPMILGTVQFEDEAEMREVTGDLMALYNDVAHDLEHGHYGPIVIHMPMEDEQPPLPLPYGWCEGYVRGMVVHGEQQLAQLTEDAEGAELIARMVGFLEYEEGQLTNPPDPDKHRESALALGDAALALFHWWLPRREPQHRPS